MNLSRLDIQNKISEIRGDSTITVTDLIAPMAKWFDTMDLSDEINSHDFIRNHILSDLGSYEGVI